MPPEVPLPPSASLLTLVGDTHGDADALRAALRFASDSGASWALSVGDLWWRPRSEAHAPFFRALTDAAEQCQVRIMLVDGNNDDAAHLLAGRPHASPVPVTDRLWYAPRGSAWVWQGRRFLALGGAMTFRREGKRPGVELFEGEAISGEDVRRARAAGAADILVCHDAPEYSPIVQHLRPGPDEKQRAFVSETAASASPKILFHGHYHRSYEHRTPSGQLVVGLGRDEGGSADVCLLDLPSLQLLQHVRTPSSS